MADDNLREVTTESISATKSLNKLSVAIDKLAKSTETVKLTRFNTQLQTLSTTISSIQAPTNMNKFANSISKLSNIAGNVSFAGFSKKMEALVKGLGVFSNTNLGDTKGISNLLNSISKLPKTIESINNIDSKQLELFTQRVTKLVNDLAPLNSKLGNVLTLFKLYPSVVRGASKPTHSFGSRIKSLNSKFFNLQRLLGGVGIIFLIRKLTHTLSDCFKISNDYIETLNLFAVSMDSNGDEAKKLVDSWQAILGLDPELVMEQWGELNLLLQGFGDTSEQWNNASYSMSKNISQLAYDMSSLYNVDVETAFAKLQSGMSGMSRPLRAWGIDISQTALEEFALTKGIEKSVKTMTQAEKAQLRYMIIMEKTAEKAMNIQGDLARTITTPGNALRILKQQFTQLKRAIGDFITPIVSRFIPYVKAFTEGLIEMFKALTEVMNTITGYSPKTMEDFQSNLQGSSTFAEDAAESYEELTNSIYGLVSGIDKFNTLSKGNDEENIVGGYFLDEEALEDYDFTKGLEEQISEAKRVLQPFFKDLTEKLKAFIERVNMIDDPLGKMIKLFKILIGIKLSLWAIQGTLGLVNLYINFKKLIGVVISAIRTMLLFAASVIKKVVVAISVLIGEINMGMISITTLISGFAALIAGIAIFIALAGRMGSWQKVITIFTSLAVAIAAAAIALNAFKGGIGAAITAASIAGGVVLATGSIIAASSKNKFADGGLPTTGSLFVANEKGPEWLGKMGNSSAVVNDSQMSDIMYNAVKDGVIDAMYIGDGEDNKNININFNGLNSNELARVLCTPVITELTRRGYKIQKA